MAPLPVPWDPREPLVLAGSEVRATPILYGFFPRGVHGTTKSLPPPSQSSLQAAHCGWGNQISWDP